MIRTRRPIRIVILIILTVVFISQSGADELQDISFLNQSIPDILQVLGEVAGMTVLSDETVTGFASFVSPVLPPRDALELFLEQERLYGVWDGSVLRVSRVSVKIIEDGMISLDAEGVEAQDVMAALARIAPTTVLYDALPRITLDIHVDGLPIRDILSLILRRMPDYSLEEDETYLYVRLSRAGQTTSSPGRSGGTSVSRSGDLYALDLEQGRFRDILDQLFLTAEIEYSYLGRNDAVLSRLKFRSRSFDELLTLLVEQAQADFLKVSDLYYIYDLRQTDVLAKYYSVIHRPLEHLDVRNVLQIIPSDLAPPGMIKIDASNNALILYGTLDTLGPLQEFLDTMDRPLEGRTWIRYDLDYIDPGGLQALLPSELSMLNVTAIPNTSSVIVSVSETQADALDAFLEATDRPEEGTAIWLRYIKSEDLLAHIPPSFDEQDISRTQNPSLIFFKGSEDKLAAFRRILESMDKPVPQIRYNLLVVNYQDSQGFDWETGASFGPSESGDVTAFTGSLSPLLNLDFDIASIFGYQFALKLSASLEESRSKVIADTTLNGLSGEKISFRNTNTYRYRDYRIDPVTGEQISEGSREITSGLFIDIEGWVSGDDMITMDISATISQQQDADSTSTDVLPPTTERVVDTFVRAPAGSPVIISGLTQQNTVITEQKTPFLGDIPLLGWLFKKKVQSQEDTELVIYIVPYIEYDRNDTVDDGGLFERIYMKYVQEP